MPEPRHAFIVGAGFSSHAGLPLTGGFTAALLEGKDQLPRDKRLVEFLKAFLGDAHGHSAGTAANDWPFLEDVFTSVDLAANSGHNLGKRYAPKELRTVRRALIVRTIRMLHHHYGRVGKPSERYLEGLNRFFDRLDLAETAFISMNWDTVIERKLQERRNIRTIDYGCEAEAGQFVKSKAQSRSIGSGDPVTVLKIHGSLNWLYCDNCRTLFWFNPADARKIANRLFTSRDWEIVAAFGISRRDAMGASTLCPDCRVDALGTRLATFSYRKALDFPMLQLTWHSAETVLRHAMTWVFIGYSLPPADYEFKYLLKQVQLSRQKKPKLVLITGGKAGPETRANYWRFFGAALGDPDGRGWYYDDGLTAPAIDGLVKSRILAS